ncbi:MAG: hypothetical protein AAFY50_01515 [Cyanobacteria bacterium J06648_1]
MAEPSLAKSVSYVQYLNQYSDQPKLSLCFHFAGDRFTDLNFIYTSDVN